MTGLLKQAEVPLNGGTSIRERITQQLAAAQRELLGAYQNGMMANPMSPDLPVFQDIQRLAKEIAGVMQQVSKVRGL